MKKLAAAARKFVEGQEGPTMVEYAILVAFIAIACFLIVSNLGTQVSAVFSVLSSSLAGMV